MVIYSMSHALIQLLRYAAKYCADIFISGNPMGCYLSKSEAGQFPDRKMILPMIPHGRFLKASLCFVHIDQIKRSRHTKQQTPMKALYRNDVVAHP